MERKRRFVLGHNGWFVRPKSNRGGLPKPDPLGRWRPEVGVNSEGKRVRFQVGNRRDTTEAEARKRLDAIRDLYDRQCAELKIDFWAGWVLGWAEKLARGVPILVGASSAAANIPGQAAEELAVVRRLQSWGVPMVVGDDLPSRGHAFLSQQIETEVQRAVTAAVADLKKAWSPDLIEEATQHAGLPADPKTVPLGTVHETMAAYKRHLEQTGKRDGQGNLSPHARKCMERMDVLLEHHQDGSLWQLDFAKVEAMVSYWKNRPLTKRGSRCSVEHASKMIQELFRFLRWLDRQPRHRWSMPRGAEQLKRVPIRLPEDDQREPTAFRSTTKETYTPEQLAIIARHTDDFGRAILGVSVNCAFGASEIGQWATGQYHLFAKHPHATTLGITSTDQDSWVVGKRPKTGIYGEHLLWEEVSRQVRPFLGGRAVLPVTGTGVPWYRPHSKNAQSQFGNWWSDTLDRVEKEHAGFPRLAFGTLRDLLPNILRREYSDEVASLALQHGKLSSDDLLDCYANLPFRKLFEATKELRTMFQPFLDAING